MTGLAEDSLVASSKPSPLRGIIAIVAAVGVVGGAAWWLTRGKGQPEDPARVLIVGPSPGLEPWLADRGFDPGYLSVGQAIGEGQAYDRSLADLPAMLEYADQRGYGYLALDLAQGQRYDFSTIGYEAEPPPPGSSFAVVSVGSLGESVTFGGVVPEVRHEIETAERVGLLLALFGQEAISKSRTRDASNDLMIRFGSARTVEDVLEYEEAQKHMQRQIVAWRDLGERERGEPKPIELARPYEPLRAWPLANGMVLLAGGRDAWRSSDGLRTTWVGEELDAGFSVISLDDPSTRSPCETLPETLAYDGGFVVAPAGDALLIPSDLYVADLWVLPGPPTGTGCGFEKRDQIRRLEQGELGVPRSSGRTAASQRGRLNWADAKMRAYRSLGIEGVELRDGALQWLDDHTVVVPASIDYARAAAGRAARMAEAGGLAAPPVEPAASARAGEALVFIQLPAPQQDDVRVSIVPVDRLSGLLSGPAGEQTIAAVFVLSGKPGHLAVQLDTPSGSRVIELGLQGERAWHDALAVDFDLAAAARPPETALHVTVLAENLPASLSDLAIAPDGRSAAWSASPSEGSELEIMWLAFGDPTPQRMTNNDRSDARPRFVSSGLVFDSVYRAAEEFPQVEAVRALSLP